MFDSTKVKELEEKIKDVRHRLFSAKTPPTKRKLREEDQKLREEMGTMLESAGWGNETAKQLAGWDPYNQNASSPFFDPEWMFGIGDGFDVVIGNPPYVQIPKGSVSSDVFVYSEGKDKGKQNLYKVFIEAAYNISKQGGCQCLIVQSSLLCDLSSQYTRQLLLSKTRIQCMIEFPKIAPTKDGQVFETVLQGTCVYVTLKMEPPKQHVFNISVNNDVTTIGNIMSEEIRQDVILDIYPESFNIPLIQKGEFEIISKITDRAIRLKDMMQSINQGDINLTGSKSYITNTKTTTKLLRGKNISKYYIDYCVDEYIGRNHKKELVIDNQKNVYLVCQEVTGTVDKWRLHFAITDVAESFLFGHTANKILLKNSKHNYDLLAILNSKLMDWLFRKTSTNNHVGGYEIEQLPIIPIPKTGSLKTLTTYLIILKRNTGDPRYLNGLHTIIDAMIYELYFPDEIKAAKAEVLKHLTSLPELKEDWSDEKKMKTIEKVYQELSDPKHPVAVAMERQKTVKEVRIIEGLDK